MICPDLFCLWVAIVQPTVKGISDSPKLKHRFGQIKIIALEVKY